MSSRPGAAAGGRVEATGPGPVVAVKGVVGSSPAAGKAVEAADTAEVAGTVAGKPVGTAVAVGTVVGWLAAENFPGRARRGLQRRGKEFPEASPAGQRG